MGAGAGKDQQVTTKLQGMDCCGRQTFPQVGSVLVYQSKLSQESSLWVADVMVEADNFEAHLSNYITSRKCIQPFFPTVAVEVSQEESLSIGMCGACTGSKRIRVLMKPYPRTLLTEVIHRAAIPGGAEFFEESEIWYILGQLIEVEVFMQSSPRDTHGNISLFSIMISEDGLAVLPDPLLLFPRDTNYTRSYLSEYRGPLSPEELVARASKQSIPKINSEAVEVWALGLVTLCTCLLVGEDKFYAFKEGTLWLNRTLLDEGLRKVEKRYSHQLTELIRGCLFDNPSNRMMFNTLRLIVEDARKEEISSINRSAH